MHARHPYGSHMHVQLKQLTTPTTKETKRCLAWSCRSMRAGGRPGRGRGGRTGPEEPLRTAVRRWSVRLCTRVDRRSPFTAASRPLLRGFGGGDRGFTLARRGRGARIHMEGPGRCGRVLPPAQQSRETCAAGCRRRLAQLHWSGLHSNVQRDQKVQEELGSAAVIDWRQNSAACSEDEHTVGCKVRSGTQTKNCWGSFFGRCA